MNIERVDDLRASSWCRRLGSIKDDEAVSRSKRSIDREEGSRRWEDGLEVVKRGCPSGGSRLKNEESRISAGVDLLPFQNQSYGFKEDDREKKKQGESAIHQSKTSKEL